MIQEIKLKKCKICKTEYQQLNSFHSVCKPSCAIELAKKRRDKKEKEERRKTKKRLLALKPRTWWIKKAEKACNAYIRERDKYEPCISCGRYHKGQWHAGHHLTVAARPELRYHPANINRQCKPCNKDLSGNITEYRKGSVEKWGAEMVDYLENFNKPQHWTIEEIQEIEAHYKELLKHLKANNGN